MPLVYRCTDGHDTAVAIGTDAPETWDCCICGLPSARLPATEGLAEEVAAALDTECAAFDADPAMTLLQWAVDVVQGLVNAHGGLIRVDADLKAGMLGRIDANVLAYMRHMRALRFPVEATDCAVTYMGAGTWCCHYPRHEIRSGHTDLDREGHRATPGGQAGEGVAPVHEVLLAALLDPEAGGLEGHGGCAPCGWSERTSRTVGICLRCAVAPSLPPDLPPRRGGSGGRRPLRTAPERTKALVSELTRASATGVSDGARTRDTQDHNLVLYQLSYTHHAPAGRERRWEPA